MNRWFYRNSIDRFLSDDPDALIGAMAKANPFPLEASQRDAWIEEISILRPVLAGRDGWIFFEYSIPRLGKRVDVVLLLDSTIFVLEFKVGAARYLRADRDQVWDYALDLANFHETSHNRYIAPILVSTRAGLPHCASAQQLEAGQDLRADLLQQRDPRLGDRCRARLW